ncbi:DEAD/DEAH box helicase [Catenovulum sp. 2E275]|uniref:DEAD/DEAH box helicase n=1 Tax=Catenovulum sp. 2E275 TaxID=2980497 RepID=UPI0021D2D6D8|nr:DEAD/DEAH box helicase [Catenovulum sp. 2E275]MCU4674567.1 DEAD/DEAH box helicase [Catenovulum sp. 2E275]
MNSFNQLNLSPLLLQALADHNYTTPTQIQASCIPVILNGKDVLAGAQTGTGKTAAFALPVLTQLLNSTQVNSQKPSALILVPTRELAQQVCKSFQKYAAHTQLNCMYAYGGVSINPQIKQLKQVVDILVATPGRLIDLLKHKALMLDEVKFLIFDEADRLLDMGFKDEIQFIRKHISSKPQTLFFSATFNDHVYKLAKKQLTDPEYIEVDQRNSAAQTVEQIVYAVDNKQKASLLSYLIGSNNWQQVLVFTRTKQSADNLVKELILSGLQAVAIHGDKSQAMREKAFSDFKNSQLRVLVATDVAARGLDVKSLELVINFELPHDSEDYIHRIGRTGRAGLTGKAISLVSENEQALLKPIEDLIGSRLTAQWYPGFEPNLDKFDESPKKPKKLTKKAARAAALGLTKKAKA